MKDERRLFIGSPFPTLSICSCLNLVFHIVGKVAEEVYARKFFQLVDGNDIFLEVILAAVNILVECPECESLISLTVFIQYCHIEILWHNELSLHPFYNIQFIIDSSTLTYVQAATMSMVAASSI